MHGHPERESNDTRGSPSCLTHALRPRTGPAARQEGPPDRHRRWPAPLLTRSHPNGLTDAIPPPPSSAPHAPPRRAQQAGAPSAAARNASRNSTRGEAHRAGADRPLVDPGSFVEFDRFGHPPLHRLRDGKRRRCLADGVRHRLRAGRRAKGVRLRAGLHRSSGGSLSGANAQKICKVMDSRDEGRGARHRPEPDSRGGARFKKPGSSRSPGTPKRSSPEHGLASGSGIPQPSQADHGAVRGGRGVLAGDHGLHPDGRRPSNMFITGRSVIKSGSPHEEVRKKALGGATHARLEEPACAHLRARTTEPASPGAGASSFSPRTTTKTPLRPTTRIRRRATGSPTLDARSRSSGTSPYDRERT